MKKPTQKQIETAAELIGALNQGGITTEEILSGLVEIQSNRNQLEPHLKALNLWKKSRVPLIMEFFSSPIPELDGESFFSWSAHLEPSENWTACDPYGVYGKYEGNLAIHSSSRLIKILDEGFDPKRDGSHLGGRTAIALRSSGLLYRPQPRPVLIDGREELVWLFLVDIGVLFMDHYEIIDKAGARPCP